MIAAWNSHALKEWVVTVQVLRQGRQILLVRKGGIHEQRNGFSLKHQEFFLFPTVLHQNASSIHRAFQADFENLTVPVGDSVRFDTYALVRETIHIRELESLRPLDGLHTLNWKSVEQRFHYRNRPGLNLLLLQIYALPSAHELEHIKQYEGCVSWVDLDRRLSTAGAQSVLSQDEFDDQVENIRHLVGKQVV